MDENKTPFLTKLQIIFGVTKSEIIFVSIIFLGLFAGVIIKYVNNYNSKPNKEELTDLIYKTLDSLAEVNRTTFIGTDVHDNPIPELASADTIVEKGYYTKKKELLTGKININTASKVELMKLPNIGGKTAMNIIDFRANHHFRKAEDLMKIKGIGPKIFEKLKNYIEVE